MTIQIEQKIEAAQKKQIDCYHKSLEYLDESKKLHKYIFLFLFLMIITEDILKCIFVVAWGIVMSLAMYYFSKAKDYELKGDDYTTNIEILKTSLKDVKYRE